MVLCEKCGAKIIDGICPECNGGGEMQAGGWDAVKPPFRFELKGKKLVFEK